MPAAASSLSAQQREFLGALAAKLANVSWDVTSVENFDYDKSLALQTAFHQVRLQHGVPMREALTAVFDSFLDSPFSIQIGLFLMRPRPQMLALERDAQHRRQAANRCLDVGIFHNHRPKLRAWQFAEAPWHPLDVDPATAEFPVRARCGSEQILVFKTKDGFRGTARVCPHQFFPLADAILQGNETMVRCRRHSYVFRLSDGRPVNCQGYRLKVCEIKQRERRAVRPRRSSYFVALPLQKQSRNLDP